ncbi:MAG: hypothetical protein ACYC6Y_25590 [Thermoguttaceae bacterium]
MHLPEAIDAAVAFVREHPEVMTREQLDEFERMASNVYALAFRAGLVDAMPQVPQLEPQLELGGLPHVQFETKLNLPGDWDTAPAVDGELQPYQSLSDATETEGPPAKVLLVCATPRWFHDMEVLRNLAAGPTVPPVVSSQRLTVDLAKRTVTLDGIPYDVRSELALRWVKVLADHEGEWISGPDLAQYDRLLDGVRTDRLKLPPEIQAVIESQTGAGSRLCLGRK